MKLKDLKKWKDEYCTKYVLQLIDFLKKECHINSSKRVFWCAKWNGRKYFLCDDKIYIANFNYDNDKKDTCRKHPVSFSSLYIATLKNKEVINFETVIPDDTTPRFKEFRGWKIDITKKLYTKKDFLCWYNSPCETNAYVDVAYKNAIEFLQNYRKTTFKTDRYLFYVKRDNDLSWCFFIYAKDLKTGADLKIYTEGGLIYEFPHNSRKVFVEDLSGKLSKYQLSQCKKEFLEFCNRECTELDVKNFWAIDFVKQSIQPIEIEHGWAIAYIFFGNFEFDSFFVDDSLGYDKKPYFLISDNKKNRTKIAALDFFSPNYKSTGIYKSGTSKRNHWNIEKETLEKIVKFLKEPYSFTNSYFYQKYKEKDVEDNVITNWQYLIQKFNDNTGEFEDTILPLDLEIPDYMKLLQN